MEMVFNISEDFEGKKLSKDFKIIFPKFGPVVFDKDYRRAIGTYNNMTEQQGKVYADIKPLASFKSIFKVVKYSAMGRIQRNDRDEIECFFIMGVSADIPNTSSPLNRY